MIVHHPHSWSLSAEDAIALQRKLASQVVTNVSLGPVRLIAGADVSYNRFSPIFYAGIVVLKADDLSIVERRGAVAESPFPYVPGLLSFREAPVLLQALERVESQPDVVMFDGQGIAHPRRLGIASHVGLCLEVPTVGCAKSRLTGRFGELGTAAGSHTPLRDGKEVIGSVVRTKDNVQPLFVSPGNRIDLASSVRLVLASCRGYRLPEPTRQAHLYVNELRRAGPFAVSHWARRFAVSPRMTANRPAPNLPSLKQQTALLRRGEAEA
jgi:deoxyribonuclease V